MYKMEDATRSILLQWEKDTKVYPTISVTVIRMGGFWWDERTPFTRLNDVYAGREVATWAYSGGKAIIVLYDKELLAAQGREKCAMCTIEEATSSIIRAWEKDFWREYSPMKITVIRMGDCWWDEDTPLLQLNDEYSHHDVAQWEYGNNRAIIVLWN